MIERKVTTYVELDVDHCALRYGVSPCLAAIGVTGAVKCFNTPKTCQDRVNYSNAPVTLRFSTAPKYRPLEPGVIPSLKSVAFSPAIIGLGTDLGQRASIVATFTDQPHSDVGASFDPYVTERAYNPYEQGTFWGKFRARNPFLRGRPFRLIRVYSGANDETETRHFIIDSFDGPRSDGTFTVTAKDVLKLADDDRAQVPVLSDGFLLTNLTSGATTFSVGPAGIGATGYPASGYLCVGGNEVCTFTRSSDAFTVARGALGSVAQTHSAEDRVQLVDYLTGDAADILYNLFVTGAGVPAAYIQLEAWRAETAAFLPFIYTAAITEPVGVRTLVNELIQQCGLAIWWDDILQQLRLQVIRAIPTDAFSFTQSNTLASTLQTKEQQDTRKSEVWVYYGRRDPTRPLNELANFRSAVAQVDEQAATDYGSSVVQTILARWIPAFGRDTAGRVGAIQIARFRDPPRRFNFDVLRPQPVQPGAGYRLEGWNLQDETGGAASVPVQVTRVVADAEALRVEAEEMLFTDSAGALDLTQRTIHIDTNTQNFNLRTVHDQVYPAIDALDAPYITLTCIIDATAIVGSTSLNPAFTVGDWPAGLTIVIEAKGRIQGLGGAGRLGGSGAGGAGLAGETGFTALYTRFPITIEWTVGGKIWGGGGGGGGGGASYVGNPGGGGGGGAGFFWGTGGDSGGGAAVPGQIGTTEAGGLGGAGTAGGGGAGNGGNPGAAGGAGAPGFNAGSNGGAGGAAGKAIDGFSYVTQSGSGDVRGPEVN